MLTKNFIIILLKIKILFHYILKCFIFAASVSQLTGQSTKEVYYGTPMGKLNKLFHEVSGDVYAVDENTIFIKNFNYDGQGPDAYFWAGVSVRPDENGFIIPDEKGS